MCMQRVFKACALALAAILCAALANPAWAQGTYSYAVKFVCGYNGSNVGTTSDGDQRGEATVKKGNYATEVNIFNPSKDADVYKKIVLLVKEGKPIGREPKVSGLAAEDQIALPNCTATMDDCNRIAELIYGGPGGVPTPLPLTIGYLVVQSERELDVTAVYTTELCSDVVVTGATAMCTTPPSQPGGANFGASIDIDVQQVQGKLLR